jgi:hypothetical protein
LRLGNNTEECILIGALYIINAAIIHEVSLTTHNERAGRIRQVRHSITHRPADANISLWPSHDHTTVQPFNGCATAWPFSGCAAARSFYISTLTPASANITAPLLTKCLRIPQKTGENHDSHYIKNSKNKKTFFNFIRFFLFSISTLSRLIYSP